MGSATWKEVKIGSLGNLRVKIGDLTMSSSYATGGDAAAPSLFGLQEVLFIDTINIASTAIAVSPVFSSNLYQSKIQAWDTTAPTTPVNTCETAIAVEAMLIVSMNSTSCNPKSDGAAASPPVAYELDIVRSPILTRRLPSDPILTSFHVALPMSASLRLGVIVQGVPPAMRPQHQGAGF